VRENALLVRNTEVVKILVSKTEGHLRDEPNSTHNVTVESGGTRVVGHIGLHALGMCADHLGVGETLSREVGWADPGVQVNDWG